MVSLTFLVQPPERVNYDARPILRADGEYDTHAAVREYRDVIRLNHRANDFPSLPDDPRKYIVVLR